MRPGARFWLAYLLVVALASGIGSYLGRRAGFWLVERKMDAARAELAAARAPCLTQAELQRFIADYNRRRAQQ